MIARYVPVDQVRRRLADVLVPPGAEFWSRRIAIEEDLFTWERMMGVMLLHLSRREPLCWSTDLVVKHFKHVGEVLHQAGAISGAELAQSPPPAPIRKGYGIWHHFRDL